MQFPVIIALMIGLLCPIYSKATPGVSTDIITANTYPFRTVNAAHVGWHPPLTEPGFLSVTNPPGSLLLAGNSNGFFSKTFSLKAQIRTQTSALTFGIHFASEQLWNWSTLSTAQHALAENNSGSISFLFRTSKGSIETKVYHLGSLFHQSITADSLPTNTWLDLELSIDEMGRALAKIGEVNLLSNVQTAFFPVVGRLLIGSDNPLDLRQIESRLLEADRPALAFTRDDLGKIKSAETDQARVISASPEGLATNLTPIQIRLSKPTAVSAPVATSFSLEIDGVPASFQFSEDPNAIEITAPLEVCAGQHSYILRWVNSNGGAVSQERIGFDYTGNLASFSMDDGGSVTATLSPGLYYCYLRSTNEVPGQSVAMDLKLQDQTELTVSIGQFAAATTNLSRLLDANGLPALLYLSDARHLQLTNAPPGADLLFQNAAAKCDPPFGVEKGGGTITVRRSVGYLQFSWDLFHWQDAGPLFDPSFEATMSSLFFRERF